MSPLVQGRTNDLKIKTENKILKILSRDVSRSRPSLETTQPCLKLHFYGITYRVPYFHYVCLQFIKTIFVSAAILVHGDSQLICSTHPKMIKQELRIASLFYNFGQIKSEGVLLAWIHINFISSLLWMGETVSKCVWKRSLTRCVTMIK